MNRRRTQIHANRRHTSIHSNRRHTQIHANRRYIEIHANIKTHTFKLTLMRLLDTHTFKPTYLHSVNRYTFLECHFSKCSDRLLIRLTLSLPGNRSNAHVSAHLNNPLNCVS